MTLTNNTQCQGGCGKVRSVLCSDSPADWLCYDCRTKKIPVTYTQKEAQTRFAGELKAARTR